MCSYEKVTYRCGHEKRRLIKYCHFARNDPGHQCFGAWSDKRAWKQPREDCVDCCCAAAGNAEAGPERSLVGRMQGLGLGYRG
ncbi:hypothetical protein LTS18_015064 [Coniosporium uncinatum]|uniref:Uncharacterized protein n=1 Tax=Coniosporium uncinatum TaxID=93489 RepID=A0ACC3D8Q3_9PEZI|nr:hypothetical protein LTS18_015064 [Coniosporium uncinatum]